MSDVWDDRCTCCGADDGRPLPWFYSCGPEVVFPEMCDECADDVRALIEDGILGHGAYTLRPVSR